MLINQSISLSFPKILPDGNGILAMPFRDRSFPNLFSFNFIEREREREREREPSEIGSEFRFGSQVLGMDLHAFFVFGVSVVGYGCVVLCKGRIVVDIPTVPTLPTSPNLFSTYIH